MIRKTAYLGSTLSIVGTADNDWKDITPKPAAPVKTAPAAAVPNDPMVQHVYDEANKVLALVQRVGIPQPAASFAVYQTYFETAAYSNPGVKQYNNYSGIKYAGQKGATKGPSGYAVFATLDDWANAFKHEITKGANPAGAKTLEDYAARLKANGYYQDTQSNYTAGLKRARLVLKELPAADRAGEQQVTADLDIPGSHDYSKDPSGAAAWWNSLPWYGKVGIGVGAAVTVIAITK